jgi:DNA-binding ferritin-like protein
MKLHIKIKNGHWTVNGKKFNELGMMETDFMNRYFQEVKLNNELKKL